MVLKALMSFLRENSKMPLKPCIVTLGAVLSLSLAGTGIFAQAALTDAIGQFTAIQGHVTVAHPNAAGAVPVKLDDDVLFRDIIETQRASRTKALFDDDSLLTVGEHSRIEITEHIYRPSENLRSSVVNLVQGRLRALVGKVFTGAGSKFEVRTPTAAAAARGTYFVVWLDGEVSGIANIGSRGDVEFTSGGQTVSVHPGQFSTALAGQPPSPPASAAEDAPSKVSQAIEGTDLKDTLRAASALSAIRATVGQSLGSPQAVITQGSGTSASAIQTTSTPPAVTSGAATVGIDGTGGISGGSGTGGGGTGGGGGSGGAGGGTAGGGHGGHFGVGKGGNPPNMSVGGGRNLPGGTPPGQAKK